jgi:hypothetical protein
MLIIIPAKLIDSNSSTQGLNKAMMNNETVFRKSGGNNSTNTE